MGSKRFSLNGADVVKLLKNAGLVGGAAALTYIANNLGDLNLGTTLGLVVPIVAVALDSAIKWLKDGTKTT